MRGFARNWVRDEADLAQAKRLLREFMAQHLRVRNEIYGNPLSPERLAAIERGEIEPWALPVPAEARPFSGTPRRVRRRGARASRAPGRGRLRRPGGGSVVAHQPACPGRAPLAPRAGRGASGAGPAGGLRPSRQSQSADEQRPGARRGRAPAAAARPRRLPRSAAAPTLPPAPARARIAYSSTSPPFLAHFVADGLGLLPAARAGERSRWRPAPPCRFPGLTTGEIDYVLSIGSLMRAAAKGVPVRAVAVHLPKPNFFLVTAAGRASGCRPAGQGARRHRLRRQQPRDDAVYVAALGLDPQRDVQYLNLGEENVLWESMRLGRIDGAALTPPYPPSPSARG